MRTIRWTVRPDPPIDRERILDAFREVAIALGAVAAGPAHCIAHGPDRGADVGYRACDETWEERWQVAGSEACLCWTLSPILASMGVSGEWLSVGSRGFPAPLHGRALYSARRPGFAELESEDAALQAVFAAAFGAWGKPDAARRLAIARDQLREELTYRTLPADELRNAVAELIAQRPDELPQLLQQFEALPAAGEQHLAVIAALRGALR